MGDASHHATILTDSDPGLRWYLPCIFLCLNDRCFVGRHFWIPSIPCSSPSIVYTARTCAWAVLSGLSLFTLIFWLSLTSQVVFHLCSIVGLAQVGLKHLLTLEHSVMLQAHIGLYPAASLPPPVCLMSPVPSRGEWCWEVKTGGSTVLLLLQGLLVDRGRTVNTCTYVSLVENRIFMLIPPVHPLPMLSFLLFCICNSFP